jgi:hypothetical protein
MALLNHFKVRHLCLLLSFIDSQPATTRASDSKCYYKLNPQVPVIR